MFTVSVPVCGSLRCSSGWSQADTDGYLYYVIRYHMFFKERQGELPPRMGERLAQYGNESGLTMKVIESVTIRETVTDIKAALNRHFMNSAALKEVGGNLSTVFGVKEVGQARAELKTRITGKINDEITREGSINRTSFEERSHTIQIERSIPDNVNKVYVVPAMYQQWCLDGYLSHVDYLFVSYETRGLQLRRRRVKYPDASTANNRSDHKNLINMDNTPLCCVKYWRPLRDSRWIGEEKYSLQVEYPEEISLDMPERRHVGFIQPPHQLESLYNLAEQAFPPKFDRNVIAKAAA